MLTSQKRVGSSSTTLLQELRDKLTDRNHKLANLASDFDLASVDRGGISVEHLKCSIITSACKRAAKFNEIARSGCGGGGTGASQSAAIELPSEEVIKNLLVLVCDAVGRTESFEAILWFCVHVQRAPFSTMTDHEHYISLLNGAVEAIQSSSANHSHQQVLERVLKTVGDIACNDLPQDLKLALVQFLGIEDVNDWQKHITRQKIKAIDMKSYYLSTRIYGWSSADTIYLNSDHRLLQEVFCAASSSAAGDFDIAEFVLETLVLHEGSHCIVRERAMLAGNDPTLYSTPTASADLNLKVQCELVKNCVREAGRVAEAVLLGGFMNLDALWGRKELYHGILKRPIVSLHGLCSSCSKDKALSILPLSDPTKVPEMGLSCCGDLFPFM